MQRKSFSKPRINRGKLLIFFQSFVIILAPTYILRLHIFIPTTALEILIVFSLITFLFDFFVTRSTLKNLKTRFDVFILPFLLVSFIEVFVSPNVYGGLGIYRAYFLEPVLFFYSLVYSSRKYESGFIIRSLLISGIWISLLGVLQKITGRFSLAPYEIIQGRISAVFNSANSLALFLGPIILICFGLFASIAGAARWRYFGAFIFFSIILVWTMSRGGEVAEFLSLGVFLYLTLVKNFEVMKKLRFAIPIIGLLILVPLSIYYYQSTDFFPVVRNKAYTQGDTLQIRYFIWAGTINLLKDHPFFGAGLDGFKTLYSNQYRLPEYQEQFQYPHNLFLTFWTETGILGLGFFLLILVRAMRLGLKNLFSSNNFLGIGLFCSFCYLVFHGMVDVPYFKNDLSLQFWVLIALVLLWSENQINLKSS